MQSISSEELNREAASFARDLVSFIEKQNAESKSKRQPLVSPSERTGVFEFLYKRFVAHYRVVNP
jgi:hypothetical protein